MRMLTSLALVGGLAVVPAVHAMDDHFIAFPEEIAWAPAPPSLPDTVRIAVLHGNPGEDGLFAFRLKFPADFVVPPHHHPATEVLTVISGTFHLGMGEEADRGATKALPAGSLAVIPPGHPHFAFVDEETVVQLNSVGPFGVTYVKAEDDPRQQ